MQFVSLRFGHCIFVRSLHLCIELVNGVLLNRHLIQSVVVPIFSFPNKEHETSCIQRRCFHLLDSANNALNLHFLRLERQIAVAITVLILGHKTNFSRPTHAGQLVDVAAHAGKRRIYEASLVAKRQELADDLFQSKRHIFVLKLVLDKILEEIPVMVDLQQRLLGKYEAVVEGVIGSAIR